MSDLNDRIDRAKELLKSVTHAAMATVNEDGSPHNTPYMFMHDEKLTKLFWGSHPESRHSQNILRTGQLFVVLFDAFKRGGLYIKAENGHPVEGAELDEALAVHNEVRAKLGKKPIERSYYEGNSSQKMWCANVTKVWINREDRDSKGSLIKDYREEVKIEDLLF